MTSQKSSTTSPDGRYKIVEYYPTSSDNWGEPELWELIDASTNKVICSFHGDVTDLTTKSVKFDRNGRVLIAKDGYGKVLQEIDLAKFEKPTMKTKKTKKH